MQPPSGLEPFDASDALFVMNLIDSVASVGSESIVSTEGIYLANALPAEAILELDLEAIAMMELGVTNPLGQLGNALKNVFQSIASWIVSKVQDLLRWLWNTFIKPAFDALKSLINTIYQGILDSLEYLWTSIRDWFTQAASSILSAFRDAFSSIWSFLQGIAQSIASVVTRISELVSTAFQQVYQWIWSGIQQLWGWIQDALNTAMQALSGLLSSIWQGIQWVGQQIASIVSRVANAISSAMQQVYQWIWSGIQQLWSWIQQGITQLGSALSSLLSQLWQGIQWLGQQLANVAQTVARAIEPLFTQVYQWIVSGVQQLWSWIQQGIARLGSALRSLLSQLWQGIQWIGRQLSSIVSQIASAVQSIARTVGSVVWNAIRTVYDWIQTGVTQLWSWIQVGLARLAASISSIVRGLYDFISSSIARVSSFVASALQSVVSAISSRIAIIEESIARFFSEIPSEVAKVVQPIAERIWNGIQWLGQQIWSRIQLLGNAMNEMVKHLVDLAKYVQQLGALVLGGFNQLLRIPELIWKLVPDWIKSAFEAIRNGFQAIINFFEKGGKALVDALTTIASAVTSFFSNVGEWIRQHIIEPLWSGAQWLAQRIVSGLEWMWNAVKGGIEWLWNALAGFLAWFGEIVSKALGGLMNAVSGIAAAVSNVLATPASTGLRMMLSSIKGASNVFKEALSGARGEWDLLFGLMFSLTPAWLSATILPRFLKALSSVLKGVRLRLGIPGTNVTFNVSPAAIVYELGDKLEGIVNKFGEAITMGLALVTLLPLRRIWVGLWKKFFDELGFADVPFEIPTATQVRDVIRRSLVFVPDLKMLAQGKMPEKFAEIYNEALWIMEMRGYPLWYIKYWLDLGKVYSMEITDRFGTKRFVPFSPIFEIPSRSEIVRMLQRDVFASPMEWAQFVRVYGMSDDLARMYYMLSFEYPSFGQLWKFMVRGISGMLWYVPPKFIQDWFAQDAAWLGAGVPVPPYNLNYDYNALFKAIPFYLKWIQKSNFSWFKKGAKIRYGSIEITIDFDWTADSWMLWDIAADIPGKIDARWMAKWALFDLISEKAGIAVPGVGKLVQPYPQKPFIDLAASVVEPSISSPVYMDLRAFCRLLVANGLHPAWVPITAVAEAINALSDERTLLRTGFIHLYKEGFWSYEDLDTLLNGFVVASFAVEYFDVVKREWRGGAINVPVRFLPAERKLLELRAAMDRAYDILRDLARELGRAYAENIIETSDEFVNELSAGISTVNTWFTKVMKDITGKEYPLKMDKPYWDSYAKVLEAYRRIYLYHRIRYWIGRMLGWMIYRLAYGYVSVSDVKSIVSDLAKFGKLMPQEIELIETVAEKLAGIAGKQYIPTPSQLATIVEYVPEARKYINEVLQAHRVPKEWWPIWEKYVDVKPLANDVRSLITYYIKAKIVGVQLGKLEQEILSLAKEVGYTDRELKVIDLRITLEEMIAAAKEYIPTPSQLATIVEYVPEAVKFAQQVLEKRHVPPEWRPIWLKYIEVKPIANEVRSLLHYYIDAKVLGVKLGDLEKRVIDVITSAGYTKREMDIVQLEIEVRQLIEAARQYVPTPSMLATIAEYVPEAASLIDEVLKIRRVPEEWWPIWKKYVEVKPIANEVRTLIHYYMRAKVLGIALGELEKRVLEIATAAGYTKRELEVIDLTITLEQLIENARQYIPTPSQLATIAEYVPEAASLAQKVLEARRVPPEWRPIWLKYIEVRPLANEVRRLASAFFRLKRYADIYKVSVADIERVVIPILKQYGYTDKELKILELAERLEVEAYEIREMAREWVPTILTLASLAEWMKIPQELVNEVLEKRRIPQEWRGFWTKYLAKAPYRDDFRAFIHEYLYVVAWGWRLPNIDELARKLMEMMEFDRMEQEILRARAVIRRKRYAWNEVRYWLRASLRNLAYGVAHGRISPAEVQRFFARLKEMGFTDEEINAMRLYFETYVAAHRR